MNWLSFFIGVLVGWIVEWFIDLFYWRRKYQSSQKELEALRARLEEAERRVRTFQVKGREMEGKPRRMPPTEVATVEAAMAASDTDLAAAISGDWVEPAERHAELPSLAPEKADDLKLLEGVGPKISQLLKDHGILTFAQLANTSIERLQSILQAGGPNYQLADPTTWPEQARLAADEAWDDLQALQGRLIGGRKSRRQDQ